MGNHGFTWEPSGAKFFGSNSWGTLTGLGEPVALDGAVFVGDACSEVLREDSDALVSEPLVHPDARTHTLATPITHGRAAPAPCERC